MPAPKKVASPSASHAALDSPPVPALDIEPQARKEGPRNAGWNALVVLPPHTEQLKTGKAAVGLPVWHLPECVARSLEASILGTMEKMPLNMKTADVWTGWFDGLAGLK
ncbi:MAG: hypothetical protein HYY18_18645 [Planctomycetes bacterium]|nr:hypothetical protein [Planctomycetota bacterium]